MRPDEIHSDEFNRKVAKYRNWNPGYCELCSKEIGNAGAVGTDKHTECIQTRIKFTNCGCVFIKKQILEEMKIYEHPLFKIPQLFNFDQRSKLNLSSDKKVSLKVCPGAKG